MKVKIVKCTNSRAWYLNRIGEEFDVDNKCHDDRFYRHISKGGWELVIRKSDCVEVDDELLKSKLPKETPQMKKLNINEEYVDANITLYSVSDKYTTLTVWQNEKMRDNIKLYIGKDDLSLSQANSILKVMGLNYELYEEVKVDWSKVEDGTEIKIVDNGNIVKFMKYIPDLKAVIVIEGDCFYTIDASEVELCQAN